ncbi:hypothetical protein E2562_019652 [Oryza meyeriana var. granulata]|uniref:Uncharacterized protein n=1 Tax=Oryza meyeriana var. granulata TaxID=110450 RepID=A0A6G1C7E9_9ORYZ|nr:hypothetical protein E2562_019652 [Oryza meyeriana var. granulata]
MEGREAGEAGAVRGSLRVAEKLADDGGASHDQVWIPQAGRQHARGHGGSAMTGVAQRLYDQLASGGRREVEKWGGTVYPSRGG